MARIEDDMDIRQRLMELAKITGPPSPVVSAYLNTRWQDEHQRGRARVFLKNGIRQAREGGAGPDLLADLAWVEEEAEACISQARWPDAQGVTLFACRPLGLREAIALYAPVEEAFVVAERPLLTPLAALVEAAPAAVVVFVDGDSARLVPLGPDGRGDAIELDAEVAGRHSRGGWAQLAQSRYQRHIQVHRGEHFEAVVDALTQVAGERGGGRIVLAGEARTIAAFRKHLPAPLAAQVVGTVAGAKHEADSALADRAAEILAMHDQATQAGEVERVVTEAAKGGRAVAGIEATLDAVQRGAVHRLYLLKRFDYPGRTCTACGALQPGDKATCRGCGGATTAVRLTEELADRVLAAGGGVQVVDGHEELARMGGLAARLRYPV